MINEEEAEKIEEQPEEPLEKGDESPQESVEEKDILLQIEEIREKVEKKSDKADIEEIKGWKAEILSRLSSLQEEIEKLKKEDERVLSNFREFTDIITKKNAEINKIVEQKVDVEKLRQFRKDIGKIEKKLNLLMEETGFGEILDVAKIPPNILEIVYDTTLSDVTKALWQEYGPGAERIIMDVLEDIRLETSGSEMFYFDGRKIRTRDVAKNITRGMISARQLQDTYEELLRKLLERIPTHKSKNFRAMIKLKSQEYTVDKTTLLLERMEKVENAVSMLNGMVSGLASTLTRETKKIEEELETISEAMEKKLDKYMAERDERIVEMEERIEKIRKENDKAIKSLGDALDRRFQDKWEELAERMESLEQKVFPEKIAGKDKEEKVEIRKAVNPEDLGDEERFVYSAIPPEGITLAKLKKTVKTLIEREPEEILRELLSMGAIYEKKRGKSARYYPAVLEPETAKDKNAGEKRPKKRKKGSKKKTSEKNSEEGAAEKETIKPGKKDEEYGRNEVIVLNAIPDNGCTLNRLKKNIGKEMPYEVLLDTVKTLVDREVLVVTTRGRHTIYMKNIEKIGGEKNA